MDELDVLQENHKMNAITNTLHRGSRMPKDVRIVQWDAVRTIGFAHRFFIENSIRILVVVIANFGIQVALSNTLNQAIRGSIGFAVGFPLILSGIYYTIWIVRDIEWKRAKKKLEEAEQDAPSNR